MSETIGTRGAQGYGQTRHFFHPPYPTLTIRLPTGILLILPQSMTTHGLERFQINPHGRMVRGAGAYQLAELNAADWDIVWPIRDFYNDTQHGGASRLTDPQMIAWLQAQVKDSWFAAFWLQHEYELGQALVSPAAVAPVPAPAPAQTVAQWSLREKNRRHVQGRAQPSRCRRQGAVRGVHHPAEPRFAGGVFRGDRRRAGHPRR
jgi:hypothetical protein